MKWINDNEIITSGYYYYWFNEGNLMGEANGILYLNLPERKYDIGHEKTYAWNPPNVTYTSYKFWLLENLQRELFEKYTSKDLEISKLYKQIIINKYNIKP